METDEIRKFYYAEPFRPFRLMLRDGRYIDVMQPYFIAFPPGGNVVHVVRPSGGSELVDVGEIVSATLVARGGKERGGSRRKAS